MKTRIGLLAACSIVCICLSLCLPVIAAADDDDATTLDVWQSRPLPASSHPLPSWARGNYFYVHTSDGNVYRTSISNGRLTAWQDAGHHAGGPQGYLVLVVDNIPYSFRNGHVVRYNMEASSNIAGISCLEWSSGSCQEAPSNAFGDIRYMWDSAVWVTLGAGYVFHLGGFNMTDHDYDVRLLHRRGLPLSAPVRFAPIGEMPVFQPYKGAFYKASDRYGFIYMGTLGQTIWRMRVNSDGTTGSWEPVRSYPLGENDRGDMFVIDDQLFVIRGSKVFQSTINESNGALSAWSDEPPDLPELQVTRTWGVTEPEPASVGVVGNYVCVTGTTRAFCARIKRDDADYGVWLPFLRRH